MIWSNAENQSKNQNDLTDDLTVPELANDNDENLEVDQ